MENRCPPSLKSLQIFTHTLLPAPLPPPFLEFADDDGPQRRRMKPKARVYDKGDDVADQH